MPFTYVDAGRMVGDHTDWEIGLEASIMKWRQIADGDEESYDRDTYCGLCYVSENRGTNCSDCPAKTICKQVNTGASAREVLEMLLQLSLPGEEENAG